MEVDFSGKGAHGAYTHLGFNAIKNLYHFLYDLEKLEGLSVVPDEILQVLREGREVVDETKGNGATDVLGRVTVNMGTDFGRSQTESRRRYVQG